MTDTNSNHGSWPRYGAALWALVFALLHVVWATGWYVGLEPEMAKAFERPGFLAVDLAAAGIFLVAAGVALALVRPWGRRLPRWTVGLPAWIGTAVLTLRSAGSISHMIDAVIHGTLRPMDLWHLWFYIGAILFGLATWRFWTTRQEPSVVV